MAEREREWRSKHEHAVGFAHKCITLDFLYQTTGAVIYVYQGRGMYISRMVRQYFACSLKR